MPNLALLPTDVLRIIIAYAAFTFQDIINMKLTSREFHNLVQRVITNFPQKLEDLRTLLRQEKVNLRDPIFMGFTHMIPFSLELNREALSSLQYENYKNILTLKDVPSVQLDRLFGGALESPGVFQSLSIPEAFIHNDFYRAQIVMLKRALHSYLMDHATDDKFFYKFLELRFNENIQKELSFVGISHYYEKYAPKVATKHLRDQLLQRFRNYTRHMPFSDEMLWRFQQAAIMINLSKSVDFYVFSMTQLIIYYASGLYSKNNIALGLFAGIMAVAVSFYLRDRFSPSWPFFYELDLAIQKNPKVREESKQYMTDCGKFVLSVMNAAKSFTSPREPVVESEVATQTITNEPVFEEANDDLIIQEAVQEQLFAHEAAIETAQANQQITNNEAAAAEDENNIVELEDTEDNIDNENNMVEVEGIEQHFDIQN